MKHLSTQRVAERDHHEQVQTEQVWRGRRCAAQVLEVIQLGEAKCCLSYPLSILYFCTFYFIYENLNCSKLVYFKITIFIFFSFNCNVTLDLTSPRFFPPARGEVALLLLRARRGYASTSGATSSRRGSRTCSRWCSYGQKWAPDAHAPRHGLAELAGADHVRRLRRPPCTVLTVALLDNSPLAARSGSASSRRWSPAARTDGGSRTRPAVSSGAGGELHSTPP